MVFRDANINMIKDKYRYKIDTYNLNILIKLSATWRLSCHAVYILKGNNYKKVIYYKYIIFRFIFISKLFSFLGTLKQLFWVIY